MSESMLLSLASIIILGIGAQWLAVRLRLPSILLLLLFGFLAGPITGRLNPDALFGDLLFPLISISVALILFEGGLSLKVSDLPKVGGVVRNLVTIGALITWAVSATAAWLIFDLDLGLATLLGAILVVTGPTVIGPLLRHIRPGGNVGPILMWEGIVIDPIGAVLAVLVFEVISGGGHGTSSYLAIALLKTIVLGGGLGLLAAVLLTVLLYRFWIPDHLQNAFVLMMVVGAFVASNAIQHESGLLAVTLMGIALANQKYVDIKHIVEFKENLRVLLISALFIMLAARLQPADIATIVLPGICFVLVLALIARPLTILISTWRSKLPRNERLFLAWMAPRGIIAAAVSAVFAIRLQNEGYAGAETLVPITFIVIIGTVAIYGLSSPWAAYRLRVADPDPQGLLLVGAYPWVRALAALLHEKGFRVLVVDSNRENVLAARMAGLPTYAGSVLAEYAITEMRLGGLGRLLALTPNDWVNTLAVQRFTNIFGRAECYQLPPGNEPAGKQERHKHLQGRWLFAEGLTGAELDRRFAAGAMIKATPLSAEFDFAAFQLHNGPTAVPLLVITESNKLRVLTADANVQPTAGQTLISLINETLPASC